MPRFFTVIGKGNFPFEMLAADRCFPATEGDARKIMLSAPTVAPEQSICLCSTLIVDPRAARWREFNWPVTRVE